MKNKPNNKPLKAAVLLAHLFFATIFMLQAQETLPPADPPSPPPVGAIPGTIDVSPMGAATYTIPIEVVPGTQGVQPNLSIVYNSFSGMGLLGMKWNLAGLSAITRCGENLYYDDDITAINFSLWSHTFALDGERLIQLQVINSNGIQREFATEAENFSRVYSYGLESPRATPTHFIVYTDDGTVIEYGNSEDSKHRLQNEDNIVTLGWYIKKITDANGNYMTFHYGGGTSGEIWIDEIKYTGNTNMQPYAKVKFAYSTIPEEFGKNTYFIGGYAIPQTKLLETITVYYGNDPVRQYLFKYNDSDPDERTIHLKEVVLYEGSGEYLNETKIIWGEQNSVIEDIPQPNFSAGQIVTGDYNGDGYSDYVVYNIVSGSEKKWQLWLQNPTNNTFECKATGKCLESFAYSCDINSDGNDELILAEDRETLDAAFYINVYEYKNGDFIVRKLDDVNYFFRAHFGEFNGDGKIDIMYELRKTSNNNVTLAFSAETGFVSSSLTLSNVDDIQLIDYDGNGKTKIQIIIGNNTDIYEYSTISNQFILVAQRDFPIKPSKVYYGDFNGDGITDVIEITSSSDPSSIYQYYNIVKVKFGTGNGTYITANKTLPIPYNNWIQLTQYTYIAEYNLYIADINGDGKDDLIQAVYDSDNNQTTLCIAYFKGYANETYQGYSRIKIIGGDCRNIGDIVSGSLWHLGDFNGDGKNDLLIRKSYKYATPVIVYFNKDIQYEYVKEITDGLGKQTIIEYTPTYLSYTSASIGKQRKTFAELATGVSISNGIGNAVNELQFSYVNPTYSFKRRIFLGFREFVTKKVEDNIITTETIQSVPYHDLYYGPSHTLDREMLLTQKKIHKKNVPPYTINEIRYGYEFVDLQNLRFVFNTNLQKSFDYLSDIKTQTTTTLDANKRVGSTETLTYYKCNSDSWFHSETNSYLYETITLNGKQKKTVLKKVTTQEKYHKNSNIVLTNTLSYNYYTDATNKGRLEWEQESNPDGTITTTYGNYLPSGVCQLKTVSAQGCTSRSETYSYDATQRFMTSVKNALNHEVKFDFDSKTGNKTKEIDPNGLTTKYNYDAFGNLTHIKYPDNTETNTTIDWYSSSYIPDAKYKITTKTDATPEITVYYDFLGREVCRNDDRQHYETQYYNNGQVKRTSYPFGAFNELRTWHEYTYDPYGRKLTEKAPYTNLSYIYTNNEFYRIVTINDNGVESSKSYDVLGRIVRATDPGGMIAYSYDVIDVSGQKRHQTSISVPGGGTTTIVSDLWGNRLSIDDPNAGKVRSTYNKFNELFSQKDDNGNITTYQYDILGRVKQKKFTATNNTSQTIDYTYDTGSKGKGKLYKIKVDGVESEVFSYDNLSRLLFFDKVIDNNTYTFTYEYTPEGQLQTLTYPDGFGIDYSYLSNGKLKEIRRSDDNSLIYKVNSRNKYNQTTYCEYGNGVATQYTYNSYGLLTRIKTGKKVSAINKPHEEEPNGGELDLAIGTELYYVDSTFLNYRYGYDTKGLMTSRSESVANRMEGFGYDNLDRLTGFTNKKTGQISIQQWIYANNGNILNSSDVGEYSYGAAKLPAIPPKPHAVTKIEPINNSVISANQCAVTYNFFNQPTKITEGEYELNLFYGANQQRNKAHLHRENGGNFTRYYINKYYEEETRVTRPPTPSRSFHYIYGDNGIVALHVDNVVGRNDSIFYVHTDHLGSYCAITNANKQVVLRNHFDPWGNYIVRDFKPYLNGEDPITHRGFTGHEHYPYFKIINMNGRLYDPVIGRFFSPDKYVANSSFTQDFNRYSYCRNNPLKYVDPSGESFFESILNVLTFPARLLTEGFTWINDKMNGDSRPNGYFNWGYLNGQTEPGGYSNYNPVNALPYNHPNYIPPTAGLGSELNMAGMPYGSAYSLNAANELYDDLEGWEYYMNETGGYYEGEIGGSGSGIFLDETIPPGARPTATGEIAFTEANPLYGSYGWTRNGGTKAHYGVDYLGEVGDEVTAMYGGTVSFVRNSTDFGPHHVRTASIINGIRYNVDYGHLSASFVAKGDKVTAGKTIIGLMGREGIGFIKWPQAPTHVHIAVWRSVNGKRGYVEPSWRLIHERPVDIYGRQLNRRFW